MFPKVEKSIIFLVYGYQISNEVDPNHVENEDPIMKITLKFKIAPMRKKT